MYNEFYYNDDIGISGAIYDNGRTIKLWKTGTVYTLFEINAPVPGKVKRSGLKALVDNYPEHAGKIFKLLEDLNCG